MQRKEVNEVNFNKDSLIVKNKKGNTKNILALLSLAIGLGAYVYSDNKLNANKNSAEVVSSLDVYDGVDLNGWEFTSGGYSTDEIRYWVTFEKNIKNTKVSITRYLKNEKKYWGVIELRAKQITEEKTEALLKGKKTKVVENQEEQEEQEDKDYSIYMRMDLEKFLGMKINDNVISIESKKGKAIYTKYNQDNIYVGRGDEKMKKYEKADFNMFTDKINDLNIYVRQKYFNIVNPGINEDNLNEIFMKVAEKNHDYQEFVKKYKFELIYQP